MTIQLTTNLIAVQLPETASRFKIFNDNESYLSFFLKTETTRQYLPQGQWRILGIAREVSEEDWKPHVSCHRDFELYMNYDPTSDDLTNTSVKSGLSLLRSKGLDMNVLLIEKI